MPQPKSTVLLGSGVVSGPAPEPPEGMNDSEGIVPTEFSEADDGPEFSSQ